MAGWIDPGFEGVLTLEFKNINRKTSILLVPGMLVGQLIFMRLSRFCQNSYKNKGRYFGDKVVTGPKVDILTKELIKKGSKKKASW